MNDPPTETELLAWVDGYLAGQESGYHLRVFEENNAWPPEPVFFMGKWFDQAGERRRHDDETRRLINEERGRGG